VDLLNKSNKTIVDSYKFHAALIVGSWSSSRHLQISESSFELILHDSQLDLPYSSRPERVHIPY
jgi:hypothetical protein